MTVMTTWAQRAALGAGLALAASGVLAQGLIRPAQEFLVAGGIAWRDAGNLAAHGRFCPFAASQIDLAAVGPRIAPQRRERQPGYIAVDIAARKLPQLGQRRLIGNRGRACIEAESCAFARARPSAGGIACFDQHRLGTRTLQPDGEGKAGEARADDASASHAQAPCGLTGLFVRPIIRFALRGLAARGQPALGGTLGKSGAIGHHFGKGEKPA